MSQSLPKVFQSLDARMTELVNANALSEEARADVAVKSLNLAALTGGADEPRLRQKLGDANALVDAVSDPQERDYLRRILLESASAALPDPASEPFLDELLDSIEGDDERQNALYARLTALVRTLPSANDYVVARNSLHERAEELDDLRQYEDVVARIFAADRIVGFVSDDPPLETATGRIAQNDVALLAFIDAVPDQTAVPILTKAAEDAFAILEELEKTLDSRIQGEGENAVALDDDEVEELREEASSVVLRSPAILEFGERLRGFVERRDAFDAIVEDIALLLNAEPGSARYPHDATFYESELNAALDLAATLARNRAARLVALAATILPARPDDAVRTRAMNFVREALAVMAKGNREAEYVREYAALVRAHVDAGAMAPASKLAKILAEKLDAIELTPTRVFHKKMAFPILLKAFDRARIDAFAESEDDKEFQRALKAKLAAVDAIRNNESDPAALDSALADLFAETFDNSQHDDPLAAVGALLDLVQFVVSFL